jgi:hypothetical protein
MNEVKLERWKEKRKKIQKGKKKWTRKRKNIYDKRNQRKKREIK